MKTRNSVAKIAALTTAVSLLSITSNAAETTTTTTITNYGALGGEISSGSQMIQVGQRPTLKWKISYPYSVKEVVNITPNGPPKTLVPLVTDIKMLGQGVTAGTTFVRTQGAVNLNSIGYQTVFDGVNADVTSNNFALSALFGSTFQNNILPAGTTLRFSGRFLYPGTDTWSTTYATGDGTTNVRTLVDGDDCPVGLGIGDGPTLESFLRPYLDSAGKINIGPLDMIVFMELTHTEAESDSPGYDFQDLLFVVTFRKPPVP